MKTINIKPKDIIRKWYIVDAEGKTLGRLSSKIVMILRGKNKPEFAPHMESGDRVVVINARKIHVTGKKKQNKIYYKHSGYPGGLKNESFEKVMSRKPTFPLEHSIKGMLPKGSLGRKLFTNLKVYADANHPHTAQNPEKIEL
jgi:large subunit ribosomal protein L13